MSRILSGYNLSNILLAIVFSILIIFLLYKIFEYIINNIIYKNLQHIDIENELDEFMNEL